MTPAERLRKQKQLQLLELEEEDLGLQQKELELKASRPTNLKGAQSPVFDPNAASIGEAALRGVGESLSMGTLPHILQATGIEEDSVAKFRKSAKDRPGYSTAADIGTTAITALFTGGGSLVAKLMAKGVSKVASKKVAARVAAAGAPKTLAGQTILGAGQGGAEGLARSDADSLRGKAIDTLVGAGLGGVSIEGAQLVGQGIRGTGRIIKDTAKKAGRGLSALGEKISPLGNKEIREAYKDSVIRGGVSSEVAEAYSGMMGSPKRLKDAIGADQNYRAEAEGIENTVAAFRTKVKEGIYAHYNKLSKKANEEMGDRFPELSKRAGGILKNVREDLADDQKKLYSDRTREVFEQAEIIMHGGGRESRKALKEAGETQKFAPIAESRVEDLLRAKRHIDNQINFAKKEGLDLDEKLLREVRAELDEIYKEVPALKKADNFWTDFQNEGRPMLDSFTGRGKNAERISTHGVDKWVRDAGGAGALERDSLRRRFSKFTKDNPDIEGVSAEDLKTFDKKFQKYRDSQDLRNLVAESGSRTGKSAKDMISVTGGASVGAGIAGVPGAIVGGGAGLIANKVMKPIRNPAGYLRGVQQRRDILAKTDPDTVRKSLGPLYQRAVDIARRSAVSGTIREGVPEDLYRSEPASRPQQVGR